MMNEHRTPHFFRQLFLATLSLSAFTFGGGYVIITLMKKTFIDQKHWLNENDMLDMTAIAQSAPGAIAVNASILVGYRLAGWRGAMVALAGTVIPPLIILSLAAVVYAQLINLPLIVWLLRGMQIGVAAIITDVVLTMAKNILAHRKGLQIVLMGLAFGAAFVLKVNVMLIIVGAGIVGALWLRSQPMEVLP
jgi:chromate transporter